jgi:excisionase family DNA binding protein
VTPALLTLAESRDRLRLGKGRLNQLVQSGELPSIVIGRRRLVSEADLARFVDDHREGRLLGEGR